MVDDPVYSALSAALQAAEQAGLRRQRRLVTTPQGRLLQVDGRDYLAFCSNDYLGLAGDTALSAELADAARAWGVGAGASHLISGHMLPHHAFEQAFAAYVGADAALLFSTGYMANLGVIGALVGRGDHIFADRWNHASLVDAAIGSRAKLQRYRHGDLADLEQRLQSADKGRRLIVTDGVFSMDGDVAPLAALLALAERYDAWLYVDDAHGIGVLGDGHGSAAAAGLAPGIGAARRLILMATLGKAVGVCGAAVAGAAELIDYLAQRARTYIYTTALPPALAATLVAALRRVAAADRQRRHLQYLIARLQAGTTDLPWSWLPSPTPIQPLLVGAPDAAVALAAALAERGLWVPAIRPPTVPAGTARLRITLSAAHQAADIDQLIAALQAIGRGYD